ncbi:hypothetical protein ACFR9U_13615 [Halorientalis brevis]|uniref:Transmembrane protein n=1 Tax=Halorientalis brevis TaxID=1126241 RepID=A0ABD6CF88_9EURY|nr:hypothetical protein [Halorientalis brevis]
MVVKLTLLLVAIAAVIVAASYFTYLYFEREAQREHERRMARERRDYDAVMEYATEDSECRRDREEETE